MRTRRVVCLALSVAFGLAAQNFVDVRPSPQQLAWQDLEIGVLIHFGTNTFLDREWGDGTADPKKFNPQQFDTEQWVLASKAAGARYLIMVAKHHDGFCLWPSRHTDYSVKSSPWRGGKGDLVREVAGACRKHGLRFGVYLSPWDRHEASYKDNEKYDQYYRNQIVELATRYGELTEFWLDGAGSEGHVYNFEKYVETLRTYQPNTLIFADVGFLPWGDIRWVGNESGFAPEENWNVIDRRGYLRWRPAEADTPLRERHWFWHPGDEKSLTPLDAMLETYHRTVGRGAQLVLGLAPDNRGLLPDVDAARLKEMGDAIRRAYATNLIASPRPGIAEATDGDADTVWFAPAATSVLTLEADLGKPRLFDRTLVMEWLADGQRIARYDIQAWTGGAWRTVAAGTTIGHKKIDIFEPVTAARVRLRILSALKPPRIREFQVYDGRAMYHR